MSKLTVKDLNARGKRVFIRVDYNVPLEEKDGEMVITDATRIVETLPTLRLLIEQGAKLILAAHLGRPKGKREPSMSLRPVAVKLADLLGCKVAFVDDCIGDKVEGTVGIMKPGDVLLLENVRYYNEEEANDPAFAEKLAKVADVYVNDAFGAAHRAHASTEGVARLVAKRGGQCAAGLQIMRRLGVADSAALVDRFVPPVEVPVPVPAPLRAALRGETVHAVGGREVHEQVEGE